MQHEKNYWEGLLNADDGDAFIQLTEYINCTDFRFGILPDQNVSKQLQANGGTALIPNAGLPSGENITIGIAYDDPHKRTVYFTWNSLAEHCIWCFDQYAGVIYKILSSSQVTGGLSFDKDHLIHSARVANGCVYWTDDLNEPRRINIDAGIKMNQSGYITSTMPYISPLSQAIITVIRRQPGLPPNAIPFTSSVLADRTGLESFTFSYRYIYRDYESSTLSAQSSAVLFNSDGNPNNAINASIPFAEHIDQDVIEIDMVANYLVTGGAFIIHSWRKSIASDAAEIAAHNNGTTPLTYLFYNNTAGIALDLAYANKIFDVVPIASKTLELAKNRLYFANILTGYTSPTTTSLNFAPITIDFDGSGSVITGEWFLLKYVTFTGFVSTYVLQTTHNFIEYPPGAVQIFTWSTTVPPFPTSVNFTDLTFRGNSPFQAAKSLNSAALAVASYIDQGRSSNILSAPSPSNNFGTVFKSNAQYQIAIHFKDNYGRECGAVTLPAFTLNTPDTGLTTSTFYKYITWSLSNANAVNEIPDFAYYYSIDITKCLRTRFFVQSLGAMIYAAKDADGNYTFTTTTYSLQNFGIAIDLTILNAYGMGYLFTQGDFVELYVNGNLQVLPVIAQSAQYVICKLADVGTLSPATGIFEIYTPYQSQANEPFFEQGQLYTILNPGTPSKMYSAVSGNLSGDVTILRRDNSGAIYFTEAMSPQDKMYKYWFTNAGRPIFVDYIGQVRKTSSYQFSNTFIAGSQNNGLSTFDALDSGDIGSDFGAIQKLQLSSKVQKIGSVMLAICDGPATASMYLGENTLISQTGDAVVAQANTVVGSIHELKGAFGTLHPESVLEFRGNIYWFDVQNGKVVQYAENGLFAISNYKMSRFWKLFSDQYKAMTAEQIEALGNRPFIFSCVDPQSEDLLFSVPKVLQSAPNGNLPDYPSIPYPFDIYDGIGKTLVYKLTAQPNRWQGSYSFQPDYMFYLGNELYSFKNGELYIHNQQQNYCQYYGVQYFPAVMFLCNQQLNKPRLPKNISAEANKPPSFVYLMTRYPYIQATDALSSDFVNKEGIFYADVMRNKLDPRFNNEYGKALVAGEELRATAIYVMAQWDATQGNIQVKFFNISYALSLGQPV